MALGTKWGLFRHYWVLISLLLTAIATGVLLVETRTIYRFEVIASDPGTSADALRILGNTLPHSVGGTVVLLFVLVLNLYKPRGMTRYGQRYERAASGRVRFSEVGHWGVDQPVLEAEEP
jgi:hypothetical protein